MSLLMWTAVGLVGIYATYKLVLEPWMTKEADVFVKKYNTDPAFKAQTDKTYKDFGAQLKLYEQQKSKANYSSLYTGGKKISYY